MKKIFLLMSVAALSLASCTTAYKTATTRAITAPVVAAAVGEMEVSNQKITYTYTIPKNVQRGGLKNCIATAIREALASHGDADVLVETQTATIKKAGFFGTKIKSVTVTGYPAKYKSIKSVDEETLKAGIASGRPLQQ